MSEEKKPEQQKDEKLESTVISEPRKDLPDFGVGDTIRVFVKIKESEDKVRLQPFEGIVLRKKGSGINRSFTVRKISYGEGVERVFPLHSPIIDSIEVKKKGKTYKSRIYYMRERRGKSYKVPEA